MERNIKICSEAYKPAALQLVERVFSDWNGPEEGWLVRRLVEEIRSKKYYVPELELIMTDGQDQIIGYAMFSRFHIEGRFEDKLLLLSPVAVRTDMQRRHVSKELLEFGFALAGELGFKAVLVEGNPRNYTSRGFEPSYRYGILAGPAIHLPRPDCLMVKELDPGTLENMRGMVDYSFYEALR